MSIICETTTAVHKKTALMSLSQVLAEISTKNHNKEWGFIGQDRACPKHCVFLFSVLTHYFDCSIKSSWFGDRDCMVFDFFCSEIVGGKVFFAMADSTVFCFLSFLTRQLFLFSDRWFRSLNVFGSLAFFP